MQTHGVIPGFSFVFGDRTTPQETNTRVHTRLKLVNPAMGITYFYTPTQRRGTYGDVDRIRTPTILEGMDRAGGCPG